MARSIAAGRDRQQRVDFDRWQTAPKLEVFNLPFGAERPVPRRQSGSSRLTAVGQVGSVTFPSSRSRRARSHHVLSKIAQNASPAGAIRAREKMTLKPLKPGLVTADSLTNARAVIDDPNVATHRAKISSCEDWHLHSGQAQALSGQNR